LKKTEPKNVALGEGGNDQIPVKGAQTTGCFGSASANLQVTFHKHHDFLWISGTA